jgi:molybdopterin synthase sulfur carrier subunit
MRVRVFGTLRPLVGAKEVEVEGADTVGDLLREITAQYPALRERVFDEEDNLRSSAHLLINGRNMRFLNGLRTVIRESDEIALFPPVGGG